jgi:hypothetical protein
MYLTYRGWLPGILFALVVANAGPGLAQESAIRRDHFSIDIGLLQGGLSYARRVGHGRFSVGGGVWGAWEPWNSFDGSIFEPIGVEAFVRMHPSREVHLELGPSLLRYYWADDCSECTGTFAGLRATAMVGKGVFSRAPRFGWAAPPETRKEARRGSSGASSCGCCFPGAASSGPPEDPLTLRSCSLQVTRCILSRLYCSPTSRRTPRELAEATRRGRGARGFGVQALSDRWPCDRLSA